MPQQDILTRAGERMDSTVADTRQKLGTIRTGRATIGILDGITVEYYGTPTPLNQVAKLAVPEANLIVAQPFDATILAQAPRLSPHQAAMRERLAQLLGAPRSDVNLKVTSTDRLGAIGREEGMAAHAVVLLERAEGEERR